MADDYAGVPLTTAAAPKDLLALAVRAGGAGASRAGAVASGPMSAIVRHRSVANSRVRRGMSWVSRGRALLVGLLLIWVFPVAACNAKDTAAPNVRQSDGRNLAVGADFAVCRNCPTFVRVPDAPAPLSPIRFVAKYELTWNEYLVSYDAGACGLPKGNIGPGKTDPDNLPESLPNLRIDWPVSELGVAEVACYIDWLQKKTRYRVDLPDEAEWEWFARSGKAGVKFPWGNEPDPTHEALYGNPPGRMVPSPPLEWRRGGKYVHGSKRGQFPPNPWGLYDLLGSNRELTSVVVSGDDFYRRNPTSRWGAYTRAYSRTLIKGSTASDPSWSDEGIAEKSYAITWDGRYSTSVALRLVLVERDK